MPELLWAVLVLMRILSVVGARPQFVKLAPLSRLLRAQATETIVHSGQHYDAGLSDILFDELGLPPPDHNLGIGSGPHGEQTGAMLAALERTLFEVEPDVVIVFGDTNTTLAGALAAAKLPIPIAHVEAGLRSRDRTMPEETNRVLVDHMSALLFVPGEQARRNLLAEGITEGVHVVGDIMLDAVLQHAELAQARSTVIERLGLADDSYIVATIHRAANTDTPERLRAVMGAFGCLEDQVILPLHPRTKASLHRYGVALPHNVRSTAPVGYLDMLRLVAGARCVITDSGGLQKEAFYLRRPCLTLREETEWPETVQAGWNRLVSPDPVDLRTSLEVMSGDLPEPPELYGDGRTAERIVRLILDRGS